VAIGLDLCLFYWKPSRSVVIWGHPTGSKQFSITEVFLLRTVVILKGQSNSFMSLKQSVAKYRTRTVSADAFLTEPGCSQNEARLKQHSTSLGKRSEFGAVEEI
jgi:hypothetical protein